MDEGAIIRYVTETFAGVDAGRPKEGDEPAIAVGDTFFIYDPDHNLPPNRQQPFATIVTKDYGDFDRFSNLNRPGVFRLNIGVARETFRSLFGPQPSGNASDREAAGYDFAALDRMMPHPVYAAQSWVSVLNPSDATFETAVKPLLADAYALVVSRHARHERDHA